MDVSRAVRFDSFSSRPMTNACAIGSGSGPEMDLLCACVRPNRSGAADMDVFRGRSVDWPRFLALATNHHVVPLAYRAFKSAANLAAIIPPEWLAQLRSLHASIAAHNVRAMALLHRLQQRMESEGIQLVPIKGPALAALAYGDLAARQFEDLDLIVRREDLLKAVGLLEQDGYELRELSDCVCRKRYLATLQNWSLYRSGSPPLDLKPVLVSHAFCGPSSADFMASSCRRIAIDERRTLSVPQPEAMLLAVCMDGANEMWFKLSSVADVGTLLAKFDDVDWNGFLGDAARLGQRRSVLVGACLAEELLGCELPSAIRDGVRRDPASQRLAMQAAERLRTLAPRHAIIARQTWFALQTRDRMRDRVRFTLRLMFVPGAFDLDAVRLPGILYPLHSLVRPFRLTWDVLVRRGKYRRLTVRSADGKLPDATQNA